MNEAGNLPGDVTIYAADCEGLQFDLPADVLHTDYEFHVYDMRHNYEEVLFDQLERQPQAVVWRKWDAVNQTYWPFKVEHGRYRGILIF